MARRGVQPDQVEQGERAHREAAAAHHGGVDVLDRGHPLLEQAHRVVEVGEEERVHDEPGLVLDLDRRLPAGLGEGAGRGDGLRRRR